MIERYPLLFYSTSFPRGIPAPPHSLLPTAQKIIGFLYNQALFRIAEEHAKLAVIEEEERKQQENSQYYY